MSKVEVPAVLLVDDNEATCTLITALLRRDFEVDIATDGVEALEKLKTRQYASILLDLRMPNMDGYGVLDAIRATSPQTISRVIILSAALATRELERMKEYEVCAVVPKPFEVETLLALVKQCAGVDDGKSFGELLSSGVILLLAEVLKQKWM